MGGRGAPSRAQAARKEGPWAPARACTVPRVPRVPRLCPYTGWVLTAPPLWRHRDTAFTLSPLPLKCRGLVEPTLSDSPEFKGTWSRHLTQ